MRYRPSPRTRKTALGAAALVVLAAMNGPAALGFAKHSYHEYRIDLPRYKAAYGHWALVGVPEKYRINAIHAALLRTGKVLLIAGSGNDERNFRAGTFESVLWDPVRGTFKEIPTPKDMFCGGHAQLPDGRLLVAGGTARYEKLKGDVRRAGGTMVVKNEDPDAPWHIPQGTVFRGPTGKEYAAQRALVVPAAVKTERGTAPHEIVTVTASEARVYVEAVHEGEQGITDTAGQYRVAGLAGAAARNHYGMAAELGLDKKDFQGFREAYVFDPETEKYVRADPMTEARWYPTLVTLSDSRVMAVSGLDDMGQIIPGKNEIFSPVTGTWSKGPTRYFPTYPALFLTKGGNLFYSGANAGYGPAGQGRTPGLWNLAANTFTPVPGLRAADRTETSASVLLPPAQSQSVMIMGGGGVGESHRTTARTAVVDLGEAHPHYTDGPDLPQGTRYLNAVLTPDDLVFTTGGAADYRGKGASDILRAQFYDPAHGVFRPAAAPTVGRDYHSEALLLPDGRIAVFGSNPLFADRADTEDGVFEKRIEVYSPPYLFDRTRPRLGAGPVELRRGRIVSYETPEAPQVRTARLMRPSAVTHVTDVEQRSIALGLVRHGHSVDLGIPGDRALVPAGWYMLFVTDQRGTPSQARWVHVR